MNLIYDYQIFTGQEYGGISRYFYELINQSKEDIDVKVTGYFSNNYYLNKTNHKKRNFFKEITFKGKYRILDFINKQNSIKTLKTNDFDIFHPTYYNPYFLKYIKDKPLVITVHDMIHEKFPDFFSKNDKSIIWKKEIIHRANKIIAISENTKNDILHFYNIDPSKIEVIYHGNSINLNNNSITNNNLPENYLLFVGGRNGYKYFLPFIEAIIPIIHKEKIDIVCVGGGQFSKEELSLFEEKKIMERIKHYNLSDDELIIAYKKALAFVYPSLYEGFGMPILEAFACNCPLACSNTSCFPEIAGDGASFFNPQNSESIRFAIEKILYDTTYRNNLIEKGKYIENKFSWEKTFNQTMNLYKTVL